MSNDNNAKDQAGAQYHSIEELINDLKQAKTDQEKENIEQQINETPLSIESRSGWHIPGQEIKDEEYNILLCTGGPAVRIIGDLDIYLQPHTVQLEYQDCGTLWTEYYLTKEEKEILLQFANKFFFGE